MVMVVVVVQASHNLLITEAVDPVSVAQFGRSLVAAVADCRCREAALLSFVVVDVDRVGRRVCAVRPGVKMRTLVKICVLAPGPCVCRLPALPLLLFLGNKSVPLSLFHIQIKRKAGKSENERRAT